jgi:hypothetical protein
MLNDGGFGHSASPSVQHCDGHGRPFVSVCSRAAATLLLIKIIILPPFGLRRAIGNPLVVEVCKPSSYDNAVDFGGL